MRAFTFALLSSVGLSACGSSTTVTIAPDATVSDAATPDAVSIPDGGSVSDAPLDTATPADSPQGCTAQVTSVCPAHPPGTCSDLGDGRQHPVDFTGLGHDINLSCEGFATSAGPDGVLPLTLTTTSDVTLTAIAAQGDVAVAALETPVGCGTAAGELFCVNGTFALNGNGVLVARGLPPGVYMVVVANGYGAPMTVQADITPSPPRQPGAVCPGLTVTPDGAPAVLDTRILPTSYTYGTTCGALAGRPLSYLDGVFTYTLAEPRDVTVTVTSNGDTPVQVDVSPVCGSHAVALPGCVSGMTATRTVHGQAPGTWYVVVDYAVMTARARTITATVTTAPPTASGPAATCPGLPLTVNVAANVDVGTLTPGAPLSCISRQRAGAVFTFIAPSMGDVLMHVVSPDPGEDVAMQLASTCEGAPVGACVGPYDHATDSAWGRYVGLAPGQTYFVQTATAGTSGSLGARYYVLPHADPRAVTGNEVCAGAVSVPATGGVFTGTTGGATAVTSPSCAAPGTACSGSRGVLYRIDLTVQKRVVAVMTSGDFDPLLSIQSGGPCPGAPASGPCNNDSYGRNPMVEGVLAPGTYWLVAGGCGGTAVGRYTLDIAILPPPSM